MNRKLFSLAGVLVAVFSFTVASSDVEARHCRSHRNRCCQQQCHTGCQHHANHGQHYQGGNGQCCLQSGHQVQGQATYGTTTVAIDADQAASAPAVETTAPVSNN